GHSCGVEPAHQPCGNEAPKAHRHQVAGEEECRRALRHACVLLHIKDVGAPRGELSAAIAELCKHRDPKVRITEEFLEAASVGTVLMLTLDDGKFDKSNQQGEQQDNYANHDVSRHHTHNLHVQIGRISAGGPHLIDLCRAVLNAGEDEVCTHNDAGDSAGRVERL